MSNLPNQNDIVPKVKYQFAVTLTVGLLTAALVKFGVEAGLAHQIGIDASPLLMDIAPLIVASLAGLYAGWQKSDPMKDMVFKLLPYMPQLLNINNKENSIERYIELIEGMEE